jgi:hypothetical protein
MAEQQPLPHGPYTQTGKELFKFIDEETTPTAVFVFFKPRPLAFYTHRAASTFPYSNPSYPFKISYQVAKDYLTEIKAEYAVIKIDDDSKNRTLANFITACPQPFEQVFYNKVYEVYHINQSLLSNCHDDGKF